MPNLYSQVWRCGKRPLKISTEQGRKTIQPGEIVPGTETWHRLDAYVRSRRLVPA